MVLTLLVEVVTIALTYDDSIPIHWNSTKDIDSLPKDYCEATKALIVCLRIIAKLLKLSCL